MHAEGDMYEKTKNFIFNKLYHEITLDIFDIPPTFNSSFNFLLKLCLLSSQSHWHVGVEVEHIGEK